MKKGIRKTISIIAILTMTFQIGMPMIPGLQTKVFATDMTIPVETEKIQATAGEQGTTELLESADTTETEEISRNYEIKDEETWDVSKNGDGSVIAKWTLKDRTLTISGTGQMKNWIWNREGDWHNTIYAELIKKVVIEDGITRVGEYAFYNCSNLQNIEIPDSITNIEGSAFAGCSGLKKIDIPENVSYIGDLAFEKCIDLESINVNTNNNNYISENGILFDKDKTTIIKYPSKKKEKEYIIPDGVERIGRIAFSESSNLENIVIPESVTSIGFDAFSGCKKLKNIEIPDSVTYIGYYAFSDCTNLESVILSNQITEIGDRVFVNCNKLQSITIPDSVTSIHELAIPDNIVIYATADSEGHRYAEENKRPYVLTGNANQINTDYKIKEEETWDISANEDGSVIAKWTLQDKTLTISGTGEMQDWNWNDKEDWHNFFYNNLIQKIVIEEGVTNIGNYAFYECNDLISVEIPQSVIEIGSLAFDECSNLENIIVNENNKNYMSENGILFNKEKVDLIKYPAGKIDIQEYNVPEGVINIHSRAFGGNSSLISIHIPESVTRIGDRAFYNCDALTNINIPQGITDINVSTFAGCSSLVNIEIPEEVINIEDYAFEGCSSLININIPENVTNIGERAFWKCSSLESINIPAGITNIGERAFYGCSSLQYFNVDENNEIYASEDGILFDKEKTELIKYPAGKKDVKNYILPNTVSNIAIVAFEGCNILENVIIKNDDIVIDSTVIIDDETRKSSYAISKNLVIYTRTNSESHKYAEKKQIGYIIDEEGPRVKFEPNGNENPQKEYIVKVDITDNQEIVGINEESLKYKWTQSINQPTKESFTESFENGQTITKNTGDGEWYLWIYAEDNLGNETITRSEIFNFDNTSPIVNVGYSTKEPTRRVTVTITSNEEIQALQGWTLSSDKKTLTKEYTENTKETISIKDLVGNETQANIEVTNIDKTLPDITIGDINQDGKIDVTDFLMIKRHLVAGNKNNWKLTGDSLLSADMNEDENVDITDMLMLKRKIVNNM